MFHAKYLYHASSAARLVQAEEEFDELTAAGWRESPKAADDVALVIYAGTPPEAAPPEIEVIPDDLQKIIDALETDLVAGAALDFVHRQEAIAQAEADDNERRTAESNK